jgi:hypothetical protein
MSEIADGGSYEHGDDRCSSATVAIYFIIYIMLMNMYAVLQPCI